MINIRRGKDEDHNKWLELSLGQTKQSCKSQRRPISLKICPFCKRKFYSAQALGGHQNAHRKERDAARRSNSLIPLSLHTTLSVQLEAHSLVHKPSAETIVREASTTADNKYAATCMTNDGMWHGGYHSDAQVGSQPLDPGIHTIDLNLKL